MSIHDSNPSGVKKQPKKRPPTPFNLFQFLVESPALHMIWGDVGTGKSTIAVQLAKYLVGQNKKVFYMNTKQNGIEKIFDRVYSPNNYLDLESLLIWNIDTLDQQKDTIFQWNHQLHQLKQFSKQVQEVGIIIIDEISPLYLTNLSKKDSSNHQNHDFIFILATLAEIIRNHQTSILLINRFKLKSGESESSEMRIVPFGGKILKYWLHTTPSQGLNIQISRTNQPSKLHYQVMNPNLWRSYSSEWTWSLNFQGFD